MNYFLSRCLHLFGVVLLLVSCDAADSLTREPGAAAGDTDGEAHFGNYASQNVQLLARVDTADMGGERLNDLWGWTDPSSGTEYALVGMQGQVAFVDLSDPSAPAVAGYLPEPQELGTGEDTGMFPAGRPVTGRHEQKSAWRDLKVYRDHLFVVSDHQPHGLQVFDLTRLRELPEEGDTLSADLHFTDFGKAHNLSINTESGFAYVTGSDRFGGGLYILDIGTPKDPVFAGSYQDTSLGRHHSGYVHDAQCVIYRGPDSRYTGRELCFNAAETALAIADVTVKDSAYTVGKSDYQGRAYAHQGWLTEDHRYFLLDDEADERTWGSLASTGTTTYIWDLSDLENPVLLNTYRSQTRSIDHNQYVKGNHTYQANYLAGLRILDISDIASGELREVAYFDAHPDSDEASFDGAWSVYPYFESGIVIVSDITKGLLVLRPEL